MDPDGAVLLRCSDQSAVPVRTGTITIPATTHPDGSAIAEFQVCKSTNISGINVIERFSEGQIVLGSPAEKINGGRRIVLLQLDRGPDSGGEVILHERVFGSFRADLVC